MKQQSFAEKTKLQNEEVSSQVRTIPESSDNASVSSKASDDYVPQKWHLKKTNPSKLEPPPPKRSKQVVTPGLAAALDRTKTSARNATYVISEAFKSVGYNADELVLSRQTVRRKRMEFRQSFAEDLKESFKADIPLTVHWDGKMMYDIAGRDIVDRLPVVISGLGVDQLLCVSKIASGTSENMTSSVCDAIKDWGVTDNIASLCFDTTSSNTGLKKGACTLIEQKLGCPLLHLACRHHIMEILLECMFSKCFGPSSGPEIKLFQRFKTEWECINQENFEENDLDLDPETKNEIISFCSSQLKQHHPRDDYKEFLELAMISLGAMPKSQSNKKSYHFIAPGATHPARWMAKAIYTLKIGLFSDQFKLTPKEKSAIKAINQFVVKCYIKPWFLSRIAVCAPCVDLALLKMLTSEECYHPVLRKFKNHLWYLSEELIALLLFDSDVSISRKQQIVQAIQANVVQKEPTKKCNLDLVNLEQTELHDFATSNTLRFFSTLDLDYTFLQNDLELWEGLQSYDDALKVVENLRVTNDNAERGVALIQV